MYKIEWDKETGGVVLRTRISEHTLGISPRPVFYEELDLLGLDKQGWKYPHCQEPLLWAVNKQYYYRGEKVFEAKGATIYKKPTLQGLKTPLTLKPVNMKVMIKKNSDLMFVLENEAIEFIRDTYTTYTAANKAYSDNEANQMDFDALLAKAEKVSKKKMVVVKEDCDSFDVMPLDNANETGKKALFSTKIDRFIASFSGGKDSQVVLDLCTRAIPPTDFEVIYSDTGYELPPSLELYEQVKQHYHERFPSLKFHTARNHESVLNYWDKIGTPSDTHRWCCSIMKTAPLYRMLRTGEYRTAKYLAFEGVRAEESVKRNQYGRIGKGVKHDFVVNARPILAWNTTEVFLYLFRYGMPINNAYRVGKPRVGCIICPFGSPWDDMIVNQCYTEELKPFITKLENIVRERKIPNDLEYIENRLWKMRASGQDVKHDTTVSIKSTELYWSADVVCSHKTVFNWLDTIGNYSVHEARGRFEGELSFGNNIFHFELVNKPKINGFNFSIWDNGNIKLRFLLRRLINKTAFCINCEACELQCPTGALTVYPHINVEKDKCIHCHKCIDYHNTGCIVADSIGNTTQNKINNMKISKYGTFGMHQDWLCHFLEEPDNFFNEEILGTKQVPSFKAWLKDSEIINEKCELTEFGALCKEIMEYSETLVWELVYVNLAYQSPMVNWFVSNIPFDTEISRKDIDRLAIDSFQESFKETTITYAVQALLQTLNYTPIGGSFNQNTLFGGKNSNVMRTAYNDLSVEAAAYSLYKYAKSKEISMVRLSDLYNSENNAGIVKEFGISKKELTKKLNFLTTEKSRVLLAELNMGLEHITFRDDLNAINALKLLLQ